MVFKMSRCWLTLVVALCVARPALGYDVFHVEATVDGSYPIYLEPDTEYEFAFDVFNNTGGDVAIKHVAITLPTTSWQIGDFAAETEGSTPGFTWSAAFDTPSATISWAAVGPTSSVETGDIREGDMLTFSFVATSDSEGADGFPWILVGDEAENPTTVSGVWFVSVGPPPTDDDGDETDDNDTAEDAPDAEDSDDDDDTSCCGS